VVDPEVVPKDIRSIMPAAVLGATVVEVAVVVEVPVVPVVPLEELVVVAGTGTVVRKAN
jgi:hypothetical protein